MEIITSALITQQLHRKNSSAEISKKI